MNFDARSIPLTSDRQAGRWISTPVRSFWRGTDRPTDEFRRPFDRSDEGQTDRPMNFDARSISPTCCRQIGWWFFYSCLISLTCDRQIGWWISTPVRSLRLVTERSDNNFLSLTLTLSVTNRRTDEFRRLGPTDIFWRPFDQRCLRRTDRLVHFEPIWSTMPVKVWLTDEFYFLSWSTMPVTDQLMNFAALSIYLWPTDGPMNFDAWSSHIFHREYSPWFRRPFDLRSLWQRDRPMNFDARSILD